MTKTLWCSPRDKMHGCYIRLKVCASRFAHADFTTADSPTQAALIAVLSDAQFTLDATELRE